MKIIFKIAKNELRNLVFSPVAWFLAIAFLLQAAIFYTSSIASLANVQDQLMANSPKFKDFGPENAFTTNIFLSADGLFRNVSNNLYLFIPLLTMGLISREVNNGTIKLLYSSPLRLREIVLGKYLAIMIYNLLLVSIVGVFIVLGVFNIQSIDIGLLLSAELGFFLLVSAYSAIGLFMSSLTTYQIVSAIGSFLIIFILSRIGALWQKYDFIRDLTYFLSISGRTEKMIVGLITTRELFYFLIVIFMFLSFALFKLKSERESRPWPVKAARYVIVIVIAVLMGYLTSRPALVSYWDTTARQVNTIDVRTQKLLKQMGHEPLEITLYTNLLGDAAASGFPEARNAYLSNLWDQYLRFKPDITFKYVYYYDNDGSVNKRFYQMFPNKTENQIAGIEAKLMDVDSAMFIGPEKIRKIIDPAEENLRLFLAAKYKGRTVHLRTFDDDYIWPNQSQVAAGLKRLIEGNAPKVYFLTGNLERSIIKTGEREYSRQAIDKHSRTSLVNLGFEVDTLSLEANDVPADITELVIADPKTELMPKTLSRVQQYINNGGNLFILAESGKQAVLNPLLQKLKVELRSGTLVQPSKDETPEKIVSYGTDESLNLADELVLLYMKRQRKEKTAEHVKVIMPGATALTYSTNGPFKITPLLRVGEQLTWLQTRALVTDSVPPVFSPQLGDIRESSFVTAIQLTRQVNNKQQRIIVSGDADFRSNLRLMFSNDYDNAFYSWLCNNVYPIYIYTRDARDNKLIITGPAAAFQKTFFVWILPGILILLATLLLIRRKRK